MIRMSLVTFILLPEPTYVLEEIFILLVYISLIEKREIYCKVYRIYSKRRVISIRSYY